MLPGPRLVTSETLAILVSVTFGPPFLRYYFIICTRVFDPNRHPRPRRCGCFMLFTLRPSFFCLRHPFPKRAGTGTTRRHKAASPRSFFSTAASRSSLNSDGLVSAVRRRATCRRPQWSTVLITLDFNCCSGLGLPWMPHKRRGPSPPFHCAAQWCFSKCGSSHPPYLHQAVLRA